MKSIFVALLSLAFFPTPSTADDISNAQSEVLSGRVAVYKNVNKELSHCSMQIGDGSGVNMHLSVFSNYTRRLGWSYAKWTFPLGQRVNVFLFFDGMGPHNFPVIARTTTMATADLVPTARVFDLMRKAGQMTVFAEGTGYKFSLEETSTALNELVSCVNSFTQTARRPASTAAEPTTVAATKSELPSFSRR